METQQQPINLPAGKFVEDSTRRVGKFKTFSYNTNIQWKSDRQGFLNSVGKPEI
ncbi:MAG: hypothetical protein FD122_3841, partial [Stygiobacter sp.]